MSIYAVLTIKRAGVVLDSLLEGYKIENAIKRISKVYSRRPKKRYIVFEVVPIRLKFEDVERLLNEATLKLLGYKGLSELNMKLIYFNEKRSRGIIRIRSDKRYAALAILGFVRRVNDEDVMFIPIATSGSLKRAKKLAELRR